MVVEALALEEFLSTSPPPQVEEAARKCLASIAAGVAPPQDLVDYVTRWIGRANQQDRYGK